MDVRLILLHQELRNQITCLSSVLSTFEKSNAAAGQWLAVSGGYTYGGRLILHMEVLFVIINDLEAYFTWKTTNVLDLLIENRELINANVHNFRFLTWLENPLQVFVDIPALWIPPLDGTSRQPYGKSTHTIKLTDMDYPCHGNFHG